MSNAVPGGYGRCNEKRICYVERICAVHRRWRTKLNKRAENPSGSQRNFTGNEVPNGRCCESGEYRNAGQMSMLSFNFQQLKVAVGNAIIPVVQAVLPAINIELYSALTSVANLIARIHDSLIRKIYSGRKRTEGCDGNQ